MPSGIHRDKLIKQFTEGAVHQEGSAYCCAFMKGISSHNSKFTSICLLHTEEIVEAVSPYLSKMAFLTLFCQFQR